MADPQLGQILTQITQAEDHITLRILEQGDTPVCGEPAPRTRGERARQCARPWGHQGQCVYLRPRTIDHLEDHGTETPLCLSPGDGGHCLLTHTHTGPCDRMDLAEADLRHGWTTSTPTPPATSEGDAG